MRWYLPRSKINTNKKEAQRIAKLVKNRGTFKNVSVVPRTLKGNPKTKTPTTKGFWLKVNK